MKPLLDQFQGCYKDKYRCFAAYYMICRVVVILIIIINLANNNTTQVLLLIVSILFAVIQLNIKPYKHKILNYFDGMVLQVMIFATITSLFDSFGIGVLLVTMILVVILPLAAFIVMELILNRKSVKRIFAYCTLTNGPKNDRVVEVTPPSNFDLVIDDSMRKNATVVEM